MNPMGQINQDKLKKIEFGTLNEFDKENRDVIGYIGIWDKQPAQRLLKKYAPACYSKHGGYV